MTREDRQRIADEAERLETALRGRRAPSDLAEEAMDLIYRTPRLVAALREAEAIAAAERALRVQPREIAERISYLRARGCDGAADEKEEEHVSLVARLSAALRALGVEP